MSFSDPRFNGDENADHKKRSTNNSKPEAVFACVNCSRCIKQFDCPYCGQPNEKEFKKYRQLLAHLLMKSDPTGGFLGGLPPIIDGEKDNRPHNRKRKSTYHHYDTTMDRGIVPPVLQPGWKLPHVKLVHGEAREELSKIAADSFHCGVTSVPYAGHRDYGVGDRDPGMATSIDDHIDRLVGIFREAKRVLRPDGLLFVDSGDTQCSLLAHTIDDMSTEQLAKVRKKLIEDSGIELKSMMAITERLTLALIDIGLILRSKIVVVKTNPRPEGIGFDRPFRAYNIVLMFAKSQKYYYKHLESQGNMPVDVWYTYNGHHGCGNHPAPMILDVADKCVKIGLPPGGTVFDMFCGSGTSGHAALQNGAASFWGCDLNKRYIDDICIPRLVERRHIKPKRNEKEGD
jgi:site-specific DNA-methyltransferase (cytosine-N4-specific)